MGGISRETICSYLPLILLVIILALQYGVFILNMVPLVYVSSDAEGHIKTVSNALYPYSDIVNFIVTHVFIVMFIVSLLLVTFTHPGGVPSIWPWSPRCSDPRDEPDDTSKDIQKESTKPLLPNGKEISEELKHLYSARARGYERKVKDGRTRFCKWCGNFKPDRTHHSRMTGSCVLEMDHYCPWVRNCIGFFNKKFFFLLIFYGCISCISFCISLGPLFVQVCRNGSWSAVHFLLAISWVFSLLLSLSLLCFVGFHVWLMAHAFTTIEYCEKRQADSKRTTHFGTSLRAMYRRSPYDFGVVSNLKHSLGPYVILWLIPTRFGMPKRDNPYAGTVFHVSEDHLIQKEIIHDG